MNITLIEGDGIGPEICDAVVKILDAAGSGITWDRVNAGERVFEESGVLIPDELYSSIERNGVALKGPIKTPIGTGFRSVNVSLRKKYDLFANIRPVKNIGKVPCLHDNIDIVLFRENTEDLYAGVEERVSDDERRSIKIITRQKSERIIAEAFEYAKKFGRKRVTVVTKANIMKETDGLFLDIAREISHLYADIEFKEMLVDNAAMQLVINPAQFDVIVTENLYGDILSDLMAGLIGGLGLVAGANIGRGIAVFEAVHGSAPDIAGRGVANPSGLIFASAMMLDYLGKIPLANRIREALNKTLGDGDNFTQDLGGNLGTSEFASRVIKNLV